MSTLTKLRFPTTFLLIFLQAAILSAQSEQSPTSKPSAGASFYKASFDCRKTKDYSVEQAICKNEELASLDLEMPAAYMKRLESATPSEKRDLVLSQRRWLTIRNSYNVNPFHGDPDGTLADVADFYRNRIAALHSGQVNLGKTELLQEYDWLESIAPKGFSKGFSIGRGYVSCERSLRNKTFLVQISFNRGERHWRTAG